MMIKKISKAESRKQEGDMKREDSFSSEQINTYFFNLKHKAI